MLTLYRFGSFLPAASRPTTSVTPVTSTLSPSPQMDHSALQVERTELPCFGILTSPSTFTPSTPVTRSMPLSFLQTATGSALPPPAVLSSSTWRRRARSTSSSQSSLPLARRAVSQSVSHWLGLLMDQLSSLVTPTTSSDATVSCPELKFLNYSLVLRK